MNAEYLEKIPDVFVKHMENLEVRILEDIIRRIEINGFSTAGADWQTTRLQQLGESEKTIKDLIKNEFLYEDDELETIFSDKVYEEYMGHERFYNLKGLEMIPFDENYGLQTLIRAVKKQTKDSFRDMTNSIVIGSRDLSGKVNSQLLSVYYRTTLDRAMMDISSGAFDYQTVLRKTTRELANSGIRTVEYASGRTSRIEVAARRAVMTGFRQIQNHMNEELAADLNTDTYEVSYHVGARPSHQLWQGKVYSMQQLRDVCGLGTMLGLCGVNCYHDYVPFIPGISVRTYTDAQLSKMAAEENEGKEYKNQTYTTYQATQNQRKLERLMRRDREQIYLMELGNSEDKALTEMKAHLKGLEKEYTAFSRKMGMPEQWDRVKNDGLKKKKRTAA